MSTPSAADYYANSPSCGALGGVSDVFVDQAQFFGRGSVALPAACSISPAQGRSDSNGRR
ncbi:MAG: hypothetical protein U0263_15175 [Polyangiaceae bacterium]